MAVTQTITAQAVSLEDVQEIDRALQDDTTEQQPKRSEARSEGAADTGPGKLTALLRLAGAITLIAAAATFMGQQWPEADHILRYLMFLGFTDPGISRVIDIMKKQTQHPRPIYCGLTENNISWSLGYLISHLLEEKRYWEAVQRGEKEPKPHDQ